MTDGPGKLELAFWDFHHQNQIVYDLFVKHAWEWKRYRPTCSMSLLYERVRWTYMTEINSTDEFKLNNNHKAFYARLIMQQEPGLRGFFKIRAQRVQCTFGPKNETLPSGEHVT